MKLGQAVLSFIIGGNRHKPSSSLKVPITVLSVLVVLFELWVSTIGYVQPFTLTATFITAMYAIAFSTTTFTRKINKVTPVDYLASIISLLICIYFLLNNERYTSWINGVSVFTTLDYICGILLFVFTLELMRRVAGPGLSMVVLVLLIYTFWGHHLTGTFGHREYQFEYFIQRMSISLEGFFSAPAQVAATYAFMFVLFGKFFLNSGGGDFFYNLSSLIAGKQTGGPAKVAVISSGLFGTVSGSPTSDVVTTGSITIPMMKRIGYNAKFAGAVESVASTGGSILPPIMGSAVFLMVQFTGIPYQEIIKVALFPALLYYFVIYQQVHLRSKRLGLVGLPKEQIPSFNETFAKGWQHIISLGVLIYALFSGYTPYYVAAITSIVILFVSWVRTETRLTIPKLINISFDTCYSMAPLAVVCGAAGIVIGVINMTGLAGKFSTLILSASGGLLLTTLFVVMVICIVFGMGMPTSSVYVLAYALLIPPLLEMGVGQMEANLFIVYFAALSAITPPIAVACYAASSIAEDNPIAIAVQAVKLGIIAFIIPFMFVLEPALLLDGTLSEIIPCMITAIVGAFILAIAVEGYYQRLLNALERVIMGIAGLITIYPGIYTDIIGILVGLIFIIMLHKQKMNPQAVESLSLKS